MKLVIADDHPMNRKLLSELLRAEGYDTEEAGDGAEALSALVGTDEPCIGLIDWEMPAMTGIEVCREARKMAGTKPLFLILITVRDNPDDIVRGLDAGANDYVTKPFNHAELLARVRIGAKMVELQSALATRVSDLESAMRDVKQLKGLLPICSYCKKIRDDSKYWKSVEEYITAHTHAEFTHGVCPDCFSAQVKPDLLQSGFTEADIDAIVTDDEADKP